MILQSSLKSNLAVNVTVIVPVDKDSAHPSVQCSYVNGKMVVLGKTVLPRHNGFAGRQIRFAWIDQANWIWNYFRSYLFV